MVYLNAASQKSNAVLLQFPVFFSFLAKCKMPKIESCERLFLKLTYMYLGLSGQEVGLEKQDIPVRLGRNFSLIRIHKRHHLVS